MTDIFSKDGRQRFCLIDEIEKAPKNVRAVLLDLMENGRITYTFKERENRCHRLGHHRHRNV